MNVSVIIPVHELDEKTTKYLDNAILSIANQVVMPSEVLLVSPGVDFSSLTNLDKIKDIVKEVKNEGETDFCSQVNFGVEQSSGDYVSILELDDEYSKIWFKNVELYLAENEDVDVFLPITVEMSDGSNEEDGNPKFLDLTNQPVWAQGFSESMPLGFLENERLQEFPNFSLCGGVIKKNTYQEIGGLKPSFRLTFIYEFLLRLTFNQGSVMTIPRIGYRHLRERKDGLLVTTLEDMTPVERNWWMDKAKKEFYFNNDREISYEG